MILMGSIVQQDLKFEYLPRLDEEDSDDPSEIDTKPPQKQLMRQKSKDEIYV